MLGVLAGFFVVWAIILVGMFVGRRNILGENARRLFNLEPVRSEVKQRRLAARGVPTAAE